MFLNLPIIIWWTSKIVLWDACLHTNMSMHMTKNVNSKRMLEWIYQFFTKGKLSENLGKRIIELIEKITEFLRWIMVIGIFKSSMARYTHAFILGTITKIFFLFFTITKKHTLYSFGRIYFVHEELQNNGTQKHEGSNAFGVCWWGLPGRI